MNTNTPTNILLIHHEPEEKLKKKLHQPGYRVITVASLVEGFRQMLQKKFALILLAILPEMGGIITRIEQLAKMYDTPIVYL